MRLLQLLKGRLFKPRGQKPNVPTKMQNLTSTLTGSANVRRDEEPTLFI